MINMQATSVASDSAKQKARQLVDDLKAVRPYATDIVVTGEAQAFAWKSPPGFGWSKTSDPRVAITNATKRLHLVMSAGTGDLYFYK
jgi:hypothetical protein